MGDGRPAFRQGANRKMKIPAGTFFDQGIPAPVPAGGILWIESSREDP